MAVDNLEDLQKMQEGRVDDAWLAVLQTRQGRRVLGDVLSVSLFGRSAFQGDSDSTLHASGRQAVGEHVISMLNNVYPEGYALMLKEAKEDEDNDREHFTSTGPEPSANEYDPIG